MDKLINHLKNFKELAGVIGVIGGGLNFWAKLHPVIAMPIGILCALFILFWSYLERNHANSFVKAIARVGIVVSILAEIFFLTVSVIALLQSPTDIGTVVQQTNENYVLTRTRSGNQLSDVYNLKFVRRSRFVEIGIAPVPTDLAAVEKLDVTPQGNPTVTNNITELAHKTTKKETYYRLAEPTLGLSLALPTTVTLNQSSTSSQIHISINCAYIDRDFLWEARQWIYQNLRW